jgi:lysophospholipase L1-like esterase
MRNHLLAAAVCVLATAFLPGAARAQPGCVTSKFVGDPDLAAMREGLLAPMDAAAMRAAGAKLAPKLPEVMAEMQARARDDWPFLCRYRADNAKLLAAGARPDVVLIGDSITENWEYADPKWFGRQVVDRGISAQTSGQILLRFYQDVVALRPRVVVLNAGTNDIGIASGKAVGDDDIVNNLAAMIDMARANDIAVVLSSILPSYASAQYQGAGKAARIVALNARLRDLARARGAVWLDYHAALVDAESKLRRDLTNDGVHPNRAGYAVMRPLAERAIAQASRKRGGK